MLQKVFLIQPPRHRVREHNKHGNAPSSSTLDFSHHTSPLLPRRTDFAQKSDVRWGMLYVSYWSDERRLPSYGRAPVEPL
jgi:hypothetical protein